MGNRKDLKAFIRLDSSGKVVPGSLVFRKKQPAGRFKELKDPAAYGCCTPVPALPSLIMRFVETFPVADPTSVTDWNTYFGTSTFTSAVVNGMEVRLAGSSAFTLDDYAFLNTGLTYIEDQINCITSMTGSYVFAANGSLQTMILPALTYIGDLYTFMGSSSDVDNIVLYFPSVTAVGTNPAVTGDITNSFATGKNITLTITSTVMTANAGNPAAAIADLIAYSTVTVITV